MDICLIVAMGKQRQIGLEGQIPWHLPSDLRHFKTRTMGHTLILGRKTFASIGKALPGRKTLVLSRQKDFHAEGVKLCSTLEEALQVAKDSGEEQVFVAGGAEIYKLALPLVNHLYLSLVDYEGKADVYFPEYSTKGWKMLEESVFDKNEKEISWTFQHWVKFDS